MGRRYDERGVALPSPVAMLSLAAVVVAGVAFVSTTGEQGSTVDTARPVTSRTSPTPDSSASESVATGERDQKNAKREDEKDKSKTKQPGAKQTEEAEPRRQPIRRGDIYVEVYNNSGITGLAGSTASTIAGAGWQVVGSDNWYGTIPASTVYYPERLRRPAMLLAKDLGIGRIMPSISPMRFDRLTVILTSDYS